MRALYFSVLCNHQWRRRWWEKENFNVLLFSEKGGFGKIIEDVNEVSNTDNGGCEGGSI